jgi:hypothetical protein
MEELTEIKTENKEEIFGFFYEENEHSLFIKTNKLGLKIFLTKLENAYTNFDSNNLNNTEISLLSSDKSITDNYGDIELLYIKPVSVIEEKKIIDEITGSNITDKIKEYGCFLVLFVLVIIFFIGIHTVYSWFFV